MHAARCSTTSRIFHNRQRLHSSLDYRSPTAFERLGCVAWFPDAELDADHAAATVFRKQRRVVVAVRCNNRRLTEVMDEACHRGIHDCERETGFVEGPTSRFRATFFVAPSTCTRGSSARRVL